jgi:hypothetical protein
MKNSLKLNALVVVCLMTLLLPGVGLAQDSSPLLQRLVGTWRINEAKMQVGSGDLGLLFRVGAQGNLEERRGSDVVPLWEPVHFDGKPYPVGDGKDTIVWKRADKSHFERTSFEAGKLILTRRLSISPDGKTLTEENETTMTNGRQQIITTTYQRPGGEAQGLAGTWKTISVHDSVPSEATFEAAGPNRIKMTTSSGGTLTAALDNKPVPFTGPGMITGTMAAWRQVDANTLKIVSSRDGVPMNEITIVISPDGKTMKRTIVNLAPNASHEPTIQAWDRE